MDKALLSHGQQGSMEGKRRKGDLLLITGSCQIVRGSQYAQPASPRLPCIRAGLVA